MKILKSLRKPYLSLFLASLMLFISCDTQDQILKIENKFDYAAFETFKTELNFQEFINDIKINNLNENSKSIYSTNEKILETVNNKLGTTLGVPDDVLELSIDMGEDLIYFTALKNGWLNNMDIEMIKGFNKDVQMIGFDAAIDNYQNKVIGLNLSSTEFAKKNTFLNIIKSLNYQNPELFKQHTNYDAKINWWRCALATTALAAATAGLVGCATIAACALAILLHVNAVYAFNEHCLN